MYCDRSGTSFGAALVAGVIGYMNAIDPDLSPRRVKALLAEGAVLLQDPLYSEGLLGAG